MNSLFDVLLWNTASRFNRILYFHLPLIWLVKTLAHYITREITSHISQQSME